MTDSALNELQVEVLRLFFALSESDGFILAGGAGLIAVGLSTRPTEDLDLFTAAASVRPAGDALEHAATDRGWSTDRIQNHQRSGGSSSRYLTVGRCWSTWPRTRARCRRR